MERQTLRISTLDVCTDHGLLCFNDPSQTSNLNLPFLRGSHRAHSHILARVWHSCSFHASFGIPSSTASPSRQFSLASRVLPTPLSHSSEEKSRLHRALGG